MRRIRTKRFRSILVLNLGNNSNARNPICCVSHDRKQKHDCQPELRQFGRHFLRALRARLVGHERPASGTKRTRRPTVPIGTSHLAVRIGAGRIAAWTPA